VPSNTRSISRRPQASGLVDLPAEVSHAASHQADRDHRGLVCRDGDMTVRARVS
jgi:hypothetical protein